MQLRDRFIVHDPPGLEPTLAHAAQAANAWALIDATDPGEAAKVDQLDPARTVLRVTPDAEPRPGIGLAVIAPWRIAPEHVDDVREAISAWQAAGVPAAVEVRTKEEGRRAIDAGAKLLVARGGEGPGRVSERSNLVLLPALAELGADVIAWGGAGPNATGALLVHADAVVLDAQVYLVEESPLGDAWRRALDAFDGSDVQALGITLEEPYHVHARVADEHVHDLFEAEQASQAGPHQRRANLREEIQAERAGFDGAPGEGLIPLGHDAAHASVFAEHGTLAAVLDALEDRVDEQLATFPLAPGSPLAKAHGTEYPIVQGAMANVSEVPAFAKAIADEGALPFLAFAALRESWAKEALEGTLDVLDEDQPFGCGIIGLDVNAKKRDAHIRLLEEHKPPYALIAAGTAEQALDLERSGIDTYLHTPSRGIVRQALEMGLTRVVVEGNECGGHIGKLPSLVLWDQALQEVDQQGTDAVNVLLAGGISDAATSAMAGTLAAGTPARVGALMGTAYLATHEITETGAIPDSYQDLVLAAKDTEVTGHTTGIRARSAPTPFTQKITELERELIQQGRPLDERKETVEHENLGATRLAARKLKRDDEGTYHEVTTDEQLTEGNFLMGQGAELIETEYTVRELHERVTTDASREAATARDRLAEPFTLPRPTTQAETSLSEDAIAVVGLGCVLPDAPDVDAFWKNLMDGHVSITELPEGRWPIDPATHHRPDEPDGTYTLLGGFVTEDTFDPIEHRIPPTVADQMDASQTWAIQATQQALEDAGLTDVEDRARWAVILGNAQGGENEHWSDRRLAIRESLTLLEEQGIEGEARKALKDRLDALAPITEDTMPGELSNIIASRVCNTFDIGGPARTVDTACASSLAAIEEAVRQLRDGDVDVAITGGVDRSMHPGAYTKFSAIGALSREGSFPFDERASGFVMGEGCGILVLKRLPEAIEDGDRIYALVEGAGSSSDGAGKGITAPDAAGQARAIERAWHDAGTDPSDLAFVEAHGTGTPVGDPTEAATLTELFAERTAGPVHLGSVKANIGHLKSAAGAAGALKAVLALHHRRLPPTPVETPTSEVDWDATPLSLAMARTELPADGTLRAGVSAFGFGGTNSHLVLATAPTTTPETAPAHGLPLARVSGATREDLATALGTDPDAWTFDAEDPIRVAVHEDADPEDAEAVLAGDLPPGLALRKGIVISVGETGELGLVFPGQGSQYPGMVLDLADEHPAAREVLERADQVLTPLIGQPLSEILALEGGEGQRALTPTEVCQPAVLTCDIAILRVLEEHGVEPDVVAGHSLGEYAALVAAGVMSFEDALHAVSARGKEMADVAEEQVDDPGGLIAIRGGPGDAEALIEGLEAWPANLNGPEQTVLAGTTEALDAIEARAEEGGIKASRLPVSAAFHSPIVAPATEPLRRVLERIPIDPPEIPVIANTTAEPYPDDPDAIRDLLAKQVANPVRWMATMEAFGDRGVELVVETGPKPILTGLARETLPETMSVPTAHPRAGATETLETALLALAAHDRLSLPEPRAVQAQAATRPDPTPASSSRRHDQAPATATPGTRERRVVVSGVSVGLPTPDGQGDPFDPAALEALLAGENRIGQVPRRERETMAAMGITRLVKDSANGPRMEDIDDPDAVVQLAGRIPETDLASYDADEDWLSATDPTARLAIAAALEALSDAKIPLVPDERETSTGTTLIDGWQLPEPLQAETGVILASAFPGDASLVEAVQDATAKQQARASDPHVLIDAVNRLSEHLDTREAETELLDWVTENHTAPPTIDAPEGDGFPRDLLFRGLAMGHAQVAQLIGAMGPNVQVNAACASTTAAIALAQDWIEQDRCERVIVVGADVAGNEELLPWVGGGFLAAGAASTEDRVDQAALPFDERRHGMLVGSGAVGLVVETETACRERGVEPLAELVETHVANSAYHGARLDPDHVAEQVTTMLDRASQALDRDAAALAKELVFVSHEPATPARGGSAEAEVRALRTALGEAASEVLITNTKGLTGHAMGAGIEDGIAVELLRARQAPPVANLEQVDPSFEDLTFSQGQPTERDLSLRFAAGFGSQIAIALFHRTSATPGQLDPARFQAWLEANVGADVEATTQDRLLRALPADLRTEETSTRRADPAPTGQPAPETGTPDEPPATPTPAASTSSDADSQAAGSELSQDEVQALLTELVSAKTGYPADVIEPEMDLEADLGVDTVKQAEVLSEARSELGIPAIEGLSLSEVPTLAQAAAVLADHAGATPAALAPTAGTLEPVPAPADPAPEGAEEASGEAERIRELLTELVSAKTGYPADVIEPEMDLEADLGVDTVKQAEVLSEARAKLEIPAIEGLSLSEVPTLDQAAELLAEHAEPAAQDDQAPAVEASTAEPGKDHPPVSEDAIGVLALTQTAAPAGEPVPEGTRVAVLGTAPSGLAPGLEARGARVVETLDEAELVLVAIDEAPVEADRLTGLLERLQRVPEGTRIVLVADADEPAAQGLPALAGTLTQEGWPARAVLVTEPVTEERLAGEALLDTGASTRLSRTRRHTLALARAGPVDAVTLPEGATVLAPGGLGAAVAPCLERLAQAHDLRLAIAGRSPIEATDLDPDDEAAIQALREERLDQARKDGESITPAQIEDEVARRVKLARRAKTLERLEATAEVRYDQLDATDPGALKQWMRMVTETWASPALVVHGAGVDASRAFQDKDAETMRTVLDVKLTPVRELTQALPEAHHVAFGSIAGVTGNPGQADYALANGTLESLLARVDGTVLHWTAWDAAGGMADDESIRTVLEQREVTYLDPDEGARIFVERFATPGAYLVSDLDPDTPLATTPTGSRLSLTGEEAWLNDHSLGGRALVPGVRHLQAIAQAATAHGRPVEAVHQARFRKALWVTDPVEATVELDGEAARVQREGTVHASARLGPQDGVKPLPVIDPVTGGMTAEEIYETFFHGPRFQVLGTADAGPDRVHATADLSVGGAAPWALAVEACLQAAGLGDLAAEADLGLPAGIEEVHIEDDPTHAEATVAVELVQRDLVGSTWDATVRGPEDDVLVVVRGLRLNGMGATSRAIDATTQLDTGPEGTVSVARVAPHEPRDPRAKRAAERAAGTQAAERALQDVHGAPIAVERYGDGRPRPTDAPGGVSITHGHGLAIAAADAATDVLGVDLERVEARSPAWLEDHFTAAEREQIAEHALPDAAAATLVWTLKEAASKALGTGLDVPADKLEVTLHEGTARIRTPEGELRGSWAQLDEAVVSLVTGTSPA